MRPMVVVPWHRQEEIDAFVDAWRLSTIPDWVVLQQDTTKAGCGATKNAGVRRAVDAGADIVIVLDGDCYPEEIETAMEPLPLFVSQHVRALEPRRVELFQVVTAPPSRGTPYTDDGRHVKMPVAASMGFWRGVPDYCAVRQLAFRGKPMQFEHAPVYGKYFPLCGMNVAFRPREWWPWCQFIDVSRYDDIWMGWLWQKEAYRRGYCFNLNGPMVLHARQSNVWRNLIDEAKHAEASETLWRDIATTPSHHYKTLLQLLPTGTESLDTEVMK